MGGQQAAGGELTCSRIWVSLGAKVPKFPTMRVTPSEGAPGLGLGTVDRKEQQAGARGLGGLSVALPLCQLPKGPWVSDPVLPGPWFPPPYSGDSLTKPIRLSQGESGGASPCAGTEPPHG